MATNLLYNVTSAPTAWPTVTIPTATTTTATISAIGSGGGWILGPTYRYIRQRQPGEPLQLFVDDPYATAIYRVLTDPEPVPAGIADEVAWLAGRIKAAIDMVNFAVLFGLKLSPQGELE